MCFCCGRSVQMTQRVSPSSCLRSSPRWETNLAVILGDLRVAGFKGIIVVVNYYSVDYSDANQTAITAALNQALATAASGQAATVVADVFTAFQANLALHPLAGTHAMWDS